MSSTALALGLGCMLHTASEPTKGNIFNATLVAKPTCTHVDVPILPGHQTQLLRLRVKTSKGIRRLNTERVERKTRDMHGHGWLRVHTPELREGERLKLRYKTVAFEDDALGLSSPETHQNIVPNTIQRHETIHIPYGDPQVALYPGGGATTEVILETSFAPREDSGVWVLPLPAGTTDLSHAVAPERGGEVVVRDDSVLVVVHPSWSQCSC